MSGAIWSSLEANPFAKDQDRWGGCGYTLITFLESLIDSALAIRRRALCSSFNASSAANSKRPQLPDRVRDRAGYDDAFIPVDVLDIWPG